MRRSTSFRDQGGIDTTTPPPPWWGTFGSMRRGRFFHHKIHIKHQDLAQKDGRYNMVMLITREMDE